MMAGPPRIFVSYCPEDTAGHAGRLHDALVSRLGDANVVMDGPGTVEGCDVVIALIGRAWSSDAVRLELENALENGIRVIPVLVEGAVPPSADELPGAIADLARRNAVELSDSRWHYDVARLLETIEEGERDVFPPVEPEVRLPVPATPFVGRQREVEEVSQLLRGSDLRVLTLTGPGGIGKTRLALEAARRALWRFPDGITWVSLSALRDAELVGTELAEALGVEEDVGRPLAETLVSALDAKQMLILIDNAEHLLPALARDLSALINACPRLRLLVTSRERLQLAAERVYPVLPLEADDAVQLFCQRAQAPDPAFEQTRAVSELCARLDQLPLAIELAAARTPVFTPEQLLKRLSKRLDLLRAGRDADPRQQTLRTTLEWSHDLLSEPERRLFARLSAFAGGWTLDAGEQVGEADPDLLQSLLDKSLLSRRDDRFWMLTVIREFAAERLAESGEQDDLRVGHASYFLELMEEAEEALHEDRDEVSWLRRIDAEQDNVRAAADWLSTSSDPELELRLAIALVPAWNMRSRYLEAQQLLERALERMPADTNLLRARGVGLAGKMAYLRGQLGAARDRLEEALELFRELDDPLRIGAILSLLGAVAASEGDVDRATAIHEEALALFREIGNEREVAIMTENLGLDELARGNLDRAEELLEEAVALFRAADRRSSLANALLGLAELSLAREDTARCAALAREGLEIAAELGFWSEIRNGLDLLAASASAAEPEHCVRLLGAAAAMREAEGVVVQTDVDNVHERTAAKLRERLGESEFERLWAEGAAMGVDEVVAYAERA